MHTRTRTCARIPSYTQGNVTLGWEPCGANFEESTNSDTPAEQDTFTRLIQRQGILEINSCKLVLPNLPLCISSLQNLPKGYSCICLLRILLWKEGTPSKEGTTEFKPIRNLSPTRGVLCVVVVCGVAVSDSTDLLVNHNRDKGHAKSIINNQLIYQN